MNENMGHLMPQAFIFARPSGHRGSDCSRTQEKIVASNFIDIFRVNSMDDIFKNIIVWWIYLGDMAYFRNVTRLLKTDLQHL